MALGWRLGHLADKLQENNLAASRVLPKRYAKMDRQTPSSPSLASRPLPKPTLEKVEKGWNRSKIKGLRTEFKDHRLQRLYHHGPRPPARAHGLASHDFQ